MEILKPRHSTTEFAQQGQAFYQQNIESLMTNKSELRLRIQHGGVVQIVAMPKILE